MRCWCRFSISAFSAVHKDLVPGGDNLDPPEATMLRHALRVVDWNDPGAGL
jgi:hypothetical protein